MPNNSIFVLAKLAERLRPAFAAIDTYAQLSYLTDLAEAEEIARRENPGILLCFKETGFDTAEFRRMAHLPSVQWVHVAGSGFEFLEPIERDDLTISNGVGLRARDLAETVLGGMLALNGNLLTYRDQQHGHQWRPHAFRPLSEQTLLVIGTGKIGTWVSRNTRALGMRVIGINRSGQPLDDFDQMLPLSKLDDALPEADIVSLHLRLNDDTLGLFDKRRFDRMKSSALFVNTSRGGIVDQTALIDALQKGKLRGAYLDVFETEPLPGDSPLWSMEKVMITPHAADMVVDWDIKAAEFFLENFTRWTDGRELLNLVRSPG